MEKHTFFRQLFSTRNQKGSEAKSQIYPVTQSLFRGVTGQDYPYLEKTLYFKATGTLRMNACAGLTKSVSRIIAANVFPNLKGFGGWGIKDETVYVDYYDSTAEEFNRRVKDLNACEDFSSSARILVKVEKNGVVSGCCVDETGTAVPYVIRTQGNQAAVHSASAVMMALIIYFSKVKEIPELREELERLLNEIEEAVLYKDEDTWFLAERALENDIYGLFCEAEEFRRIGIDIDPERYESPILPFTGREEFAEVEIEDFHGDSPIIGSGKGLVRIKQKALPTVGELVREGRYTLNENRVLSAEEEALVPRLDDMVPNEEILMKAELIKNSTALPRPFRNVLWTGETGTGKSTAAMIMAQLLHLPYRFITINPDTMVNDLYENILPNTEKGRSHHTDIADLMEEILFDPESVYKKMTGFSREEVTGKDLADLLLDQLKEQNDFISVKSPLVETFEKGGVCEIQEINLASKPGVLAGINAALDDIGVIQLNNEVIRRHPDAVIICSANIDYEGTKKLNKAVKSRMTLKGVFELPEDVLLTNRIVQNSGYKDRLVIGRMIKVMHSVRKVLEDNGETNGVCSVREIQSWAQATAILKDPYQAAFSTIVPSASDDPEVIAGVIAALHSQFLPQPAGER